MSSKVDKARAWDAIHAVRDAEREHCAEIAERLADQGRDGYQIAKVIRAGKRPPAPKGRIFDKSAIPGARTTPSNP